MNTLFKKKKKKKNSAHLDTTASLLLQENILRLHVAMYDPVLIENIEAL